MSRPKLVGLSGSIRKESFNTLILKSLADAVADRAELALFPLDDVPLYNQDTDTDSPPASVAELRAAILGADGLVIATPEYNYGITGVLKNALDWASRPHDKASLRGKWAVTLSASPSAIGGARAQTQLNETLLSTGVRLLSRPQAVVTFAHQKVTDGKLSDPATLDFLVAGVDALLTEIGAA